MFTVFSVPKPFKGHIAVIQRNAIKSWILLHPECQVILFGNEDGAADTASELDITHIPDIGKNEYGTPLINSIFNIAQRESRFDLMVYVNADIILMRDFIDAVKRMPQGPFLMAGQRWNLDISEQLNFADNNWETNLKEQVCKKGILFGSGGIDYFVFKKGFCRDIPDFAVGRPAWDNWMIYYARSINAPVIDVTEAVTVVHQNHDYSHIPKGNSATWNGPEASKNLKLAGHASRFSLDDKTHRLTHKGLARPKLTANLIYRRIDSLQVLRPRLAFLSKAALFLLSPLIKLRTTKTVSMVFNAINVAFARRRLRGIDPAPKDRV